MADKCIIKLSQFCIERFYLLFWPEEDTYSVVAESKILSPKEASAGQSVQVKEGAKVFSGTVVAMGSKVEVEQRLSEMEPRQVCGVEVNKTQGEEADADNGADTTKVSADKVNANKKQGELCQQFLELFALSLCIIISNSLACS